MDKAIARVTWSRGKYSDVYRTSIVDESPLKQGQKVKVLWGKTSKEYMAVVASYPLIDEIQKPPVSQEEIAPRRAKAKRTLVSIYLSSNHFDAIVFRPVLI